MFKFVIVELLYCYNILLRKNPLNIKNMTTQQ